MIYSWSSQPPSMTAKFWTIGYSGRSPERVASELKAHGVERAVDLRSTADSREAGTLDRELSDALAAAGIEYVHLPSMGAPPVVRAASSRAVDELTASYQDYSGQRYSELQALSAMIEERPTALICTEVEGGRCTGSLFAQKLQVRGHPVEHL